MPVRSVVFALCAAGVLSFAGSASAAFVVIDDFTFSQTVQVGPGGPNPLTGSVGALTGPASIGGARTIEVQRDPGAGAVFAGANSPTPSVLTFDSYPDTSGVLNLIWDGDTSPGVSFSNYSADVTSGGTNTAVRITYRYDLTVTGTLILWNSLTKYSKIDFAFSGPSGFGATPFNVLDLSFASLVHVGGGVNLAGVNAITLQLNTLPFGPVPAADFELGDVLAVPAPGSIAVGALGLLAMGRRRRTGV